MRASSEHISTSWDWASYYYIRFRVLIFFVVLARWDDLHVAEGREHHGVGRIYEH